MALTKEQLETFSNTKPELRYLTEEIIKYLGALPASSPGGSSYLVYTALLTQTGTDAPVATVLQNTLGGDVIWTYGGVDGVMVGTATGLLTFHKTVYFSQASNSFRDTLVVIDGEDGNSFQLKTMTNLTPTNGVLYYSTFEIRVYP